MKIYKRIIFVSESGTCRAPMAAGILKDSTLKNPVEIFSRGLVVLFSEPLNQKAEAVMISNGILMDNFMSTQLTSEDITPETLILTLETAQKQKILEKYEMMDQTSVFELTEFVGDELEIINPYGGNLRTYGLCYEMLSKTIKKLVKMLNEGD